MRTVVGIFELQLEWLASDSTVIIWRMTAQTVENTIHVPKYRFELLGIYQEWTNRKFSVSSLQLSHTFIRWIRLSPYLCFVYLAIIMPQRGDSEVSYCWLIVHLVEYHGHRVSALNYPLKIINWCCIFLINVPKALIARNLAV